MPGFQLHLQHFLSVTLGKFFNHFNPNLIWKNESNTQRGASRIKWVPRSSEWVSMGTTWIIISHTRFFPPGFPQSWLHVEVLALSSYSHGQRLCLPPHSTQTANLKSYRLCLLNRSQVQPLRSISPTSALIQALILSPLSTSSPVLNPMTENSSSHSHP